MLRVNGRTRAKNPSSNHKESEAIEQLTSCNECDTASVLEFGTQLEEPQAKAMASFYLLLRKMPDMKAKWDKGGTCVPHFSHRHNSNPKFHRCQFRLMNTTVSASDCQLAALLTQCAAYGNSTQAVL